MSNHSLLPPHLLLSTVAHFSLTPSFLFSLSLISLPLSMSVCLIIYFYFVSVFIPLLLLSLPFSLYLCDVSLVHLSIISLPPSLYLTCPLLGSSMRLISRNVVLLPLPDGPTMATFWPDFILIFIFFSNSPFDVSLP